jgi:phosphopantothenate-cysteine ligase
MHRQFSLQPFSRHYSHSTNPFLDLLEIDEPPEGSTAAPSISVIPSKRDNLLEVLKTYKSVQKAGTMLTLNFVTVNDYLWLAEGRQSGALCAREGCDVLSGCGRQ